MPGSGGDGIWERRLRSRATNSAVDIASHNENATTDPDGSSTDTPGCLTLCGEVVGGTGRLSIDEGGTVNGAAPSGVEVDGAPRSLGGSTRTQPARRSSGQSNRWPSGISRPLFSSNNHAHKSASPSSRSAISANVSPGCTTYGRSWSPSVVGTRPAGSSRPSSSASCSVRLAWCAGAAGRGADGLVPDGGVRWPLPLAATIPIPMVTSTRRRTHPPPRNRFVSTRSRADPAIRARVPSKAAARSAATSTRYTQTDRTANPIIAPTGLVVPQRPSVPEPVMLARMAATCRGTVQLAASSGGGATTMAVRTASAHSRRTVARTIMTPSPVPGVDRAKRSDRLGEGGAGHANLHAAGPRACGIDEPPLAATWPSLGGLALSIPSDDAST